MQGELRNGEVQRTFFRCDRIYQAGGQWYFSTREGTEEGPFESHDDAEKAVTLYVDSWRRGREIQSQLKERSVYINVGPQHLH